MSTRSLSQEQGNRGTISQVREQKLKESRGSGGRGDDVWTGDPRTNSTRESPVTETRYKLGYKSGNGLWIENVCPGALGRHPGVKTVSLSEKIGLVRFSPKCRDLTIPLAPPTVVQARRRALCLPIRLRLSVPRTLEAEF